jgi:hypothetical protein
MAAARRSSGQTSIDEHEGPKNAGYSTRVKEGITLQVLTLTGMRGVCEEEATLAAAFDVRG